METNPRKSRPKKEAAAVVDDDVVEFISERSAPVHAVEDADDDDDDDDLFILEINIPHVQGVYALSCSLAQTQQYNSPIGLPFFRSCFGRPVAGGHQWLNGFGQ